MRIARLDLTRYGKFTGTSLDFGLTKPGKPDLHIVYGPNEAGKSTLFAALIDLLFGIDGKSEYNFIHPLASMRIGAAIEVEGALREVVRTKGANGLAGADGLALPEGVFLGELAGLDRASYRTMFSLDDESLEKGGDSILASKGELGQLLFSASAGLASLSQSLATIRAEADAFFKTGGRSHELSELKKRLDVLKKRKEELDTPASAYNKLASARDLANGRYVEAIAERGTTQAALDSVRRRLAAIPRMAELSSVNEKLAAMPDLPIVPAGWADAMPGLTRDEISLEARLASVDAEAKRLADDLDALVVDEPALRLADRIARLGDQRARFVTAAKDLPERRLSLHGQTAAIRRILAFLGKEDEVDPRRLVLDAAATLALRRSIESRSGVDAAVASATAERDAAALAVEDAERESIGSGSSVDLAETAAVLATVRDNDHALRGKAAARALEAQGAILAERVRGLEPWSGTTGDLAAMAVPEAAEVERWKREITAARDAVTKREAEIDELETAWRRSAAEVEAIVATAEPVDDVKAAASRAARDAAWSAHRAILDGKTADAFEIRLREDDAVVAVRIGQTSDLAALNQARRAAMRGADDVARARELLTADLRRVEGIEAAFATALGVMSPSLVDLSPDRFEAWTRRRDRALETRAVVQAAKAELTEAEADRAALRKRLAATLARSGVFIADAANLDEIVALAQGTVDEAAKAVAAAKALTERRREFDRRGDALRKAQDAEVAWRREWKAACAGCWIGATGEPPNVTWVREILPHVTELGSAIDREAGLADRIGKMEEDQTAFGDEVAEVCAALAMEPVASGPLETADAIGQRLRRETLASAARASKAADAKDVAERRASTLEAITAHKVTSDRMTGFFGVDTLDAAMVAMTASRRRDELCLASTRLETEVLGGLGATTLAAAEALLADTDRDRSERELAELQAQSEDDEVRTRALFAERAKAADMLGAVGGDGLVAAIEQERQTLLLEIEEKALAALRLRTGVIAAEQALAAYRESHRSSMMARASEAFRTISRGAYSGLAAQAAKDAEVLIGIGAGGESKMAADMSKGTRFQLYLALRVAGHHEFGRTRRTVPFVADDIMETFDDFRAEEAFRVFAEMGTSGQVIYLTHHRHLCDLAREACPSAQIHELAPTSSFDASR